MTTRGDGGAGLQAYAEVAEHSEAEHEAEHEADEPEPAGDERADAGRAGAEHSGTAAGAGRGGAGHSSDRPSDDRPRADRPGAARRAADRHAAAAEPAAGPAFDAPEPETPTEVEGENSGAVPACDAGPPDPDPGEPEASAAPGGAAAEPGLGESLTQAELEQAVAALVYASPDPLSERRIQGLLGDPRIERVRAALETLRVRLESSGLPLGLQAIAGGWQILTRPELGAFVQRLAKVRKAERISGAALETLSIVAYRQPVTKAEIEAIRGVQAGPILRALVDRGLVRVCGRADVPGRPLQYGTTREFLERFGLGSIEDLPRDGELAGG
jgi:segregation and condensation protein B